MADMNLGTYSPEDMLAVITVGEYTHIMSGWADGTFLTIEKTMDSEALVQGADNTGGFVFRSNKGGTISCTLQQFTGTNDFLTMIHKNRAATRDNSWLFDMVIIDGSGRSRFDCRQCVIQNLPSMGFGTDAESRQWTIQTINLDQYIGGNAKLPEELVATLESMGSVISDRWK